VGRVAGLKGDLGELKAYSNRNDVRFTPRRMVIDTLSLRADFSVVGGESLSKPYHGSPSPYKTSSSVIRDCRSSSDIPCSVLPLRYHKKSGGARITPSRRESLALIQSPSSDGAASEGKICMSDISGTSRRRVRR
jgi:hypothetical protein